MLLARAYLDDPAWHRRMNVWGGISRLVIMLTINKSSELEEREWEGEKRQRAFSFMCATRVQITRFDQSVVVERAALDQCAWSVDLTRLSSEKERSAFSSPLFSKCCCCFLLTSFIRSLTQSSYSGEEFLRRNTFSYLAVKLVLLSLSLSLSLVTILFSLSLSLSLFHAVQTTWATRLNWLELSFSPSTLSIRGIL